MTPRPLRRSRTVPVAAAMITALLLMTCASSLTGPVQTIGPIVIAGALGFVTMRTVVKLRAERADYEQRLTAWAAAEAVLDERLRIARDLHDLVSHGLGLITVRAASTRKLEQSPQLRQAFQDIERTSRDATVELRRMLTVLRDSSADAPRAPLEGFDNLFAIVGAAEVGGLRPRLTVGWLDEVSPGVQVAVCRVVREALSNTARHAGPTDVNVDVARVGDAVVVTVTDRGPGDGWHPQPGAGHGLVGLRERIAGLGGTLVAAHHGGGYRLTATMPA